MGQKVNPVAFRLGMTQNWKSRWMNKTKFQEFLKEDFYIRNFLAKKLAKAGVDKIEIERSTNSTIIMIYAARPGLIIGRGGSGIEDLKKELKKYLFRKTKNILKNEPRLSVEEVKGAESRAAIIAQGMAEQIEKRLPYRRVLRQTIERVMQNKEVQGAKVLIGGRLDGNEIARREKLYKGTLPLQTLRANIDFAQVTAYTTYGTIGIKVWVYKKE
jgi:small subunit ribosomal protein S3